MTLSENVSALIGDIYAGVSDPSRWDHSLATLRKLTGGRMLMASAVDCANQDYSSTRWFMPDEARLHDGIADYTREIYQHDPMLQFGIRNPRAGQVRLREVGRPASVRPGAFDYLGWSADRLGTGDALVRYTEPEDGLLFGVSVHAGIAEGALGCEQERLFLMMFGHIEAAMRLALRPLDPSASGKAHLLLDVRGRVRSVSQAAEVALANRDGLWIERGRLRFANPADQRRFERLAGDAARALSEGGSGGVMRVRRLSSKPGWIVRVSPLPNPPDPFQALRPAVLVRISGLKPDEQLGIAGIAVELFGLTPTEARLAAMLASSDGSLRDCAETMGMAYATARVHLAHVFDKTETSSQVQLVQLLARIVPAHG